MASILACTSYGADGAADDAGTPASDAGSQEKDAQTISDGAIPDGISSGDGAASGACDPDAPFGPPAPLATLKSPQQGTFAGMSFTADELRVYFAQGGVIYTASRGTPSADFGSFAAILAPAGIGQMRHPAVAGDGATIAFASKNSDENIIAAELASPTTLGKLLLLTNDSGLSLRSPAPVPKAAVATFLGITGDANAVAVGELVSISNGHVAPLMSPTIVGAAPVVSADASRLYISYTTTIAGAKTRVIGIMKNQGGGSAPSWSAPVPFTVATPLGAYPAWISPDHCRLYVLSGDSEGGLPYILQRSPK